MSSMISKLFRYLIVLLIMTITNTAYAKVFVLIPNIEGDSTAQNYEQWIQAISFSGDFIQDGCGEIAFLKFIDIASPLIAHATVSGEVFDDVILAYVSDNGGSTDEELRLTLENARLVRTTVQATSEIADETTYIAAEAIKFDFTGAGGPVTSTILCGKIKKK